MAVETLEDLFLVELKDVYDTEYRLLDALDELRTQTTQDDVAQAFAEHHDETQGHVQRLEAVFDAVGAEPEREECEGIEGIVEEGEEFLQEMDPSEEIANRFVIAAAQKAERYEITAYQNMLQWAERAEMGDGVIGPIQENLQEEENALQELQTLAEEFDYETIIA